MDLPELARQVGEQVQGRPGGAVSLAVGMATSSPGHPPHQRGAHRRLGLPGNITGNYLPHGKYLLAGLSAVLMLLMAVVFLEAFVRWYQLLRIEGRVQDPSGDVVVVQVPE